MLRRAARADLREKPHAFVTEQVLSGEAPYRQRWPPIEYRRIESRAHLVGKRGLLELAAGYHLFDIIVSVWSTLLRKLHHDRGANFRFLIVTAFIVGRRCSS